MVERIKNVLSGSLGIKRIDRIPNARIRKLCAMKKRIKGLMTLFSGAWVY